ncbi:MAG: GNAT family N-acetyltransferase [Crenarchaeota archaeon 13_1_40CM_3_53_5]|nr:MAG: GNAT family N-acetyltransferase [Crenarchaeota archaeon 13_1_40CM_3_53_5]
MEELRVRPLAQDDKRWVAEFTEEHWGARKVVAKERIIYPDELEGFVAFRGDRKVGLVTYHIERGECEVVTLNSLVEGQGIGSSLMDAVKKAAISAGCGRLWLITTNDNMSALRFYQKRGFRLAALYLNALDRSRLLKPQIPLFGKDGIPLRDQIELGMSLA